MLFYIKILSLLNFFFYDRHLFVPEDSFNFLNFPPSENKLIKYFEMKILQRN